MAGPRRLRPRRAMRFLVAGVGGMTRGAGSIEEVDPPPLGVVEEGYPPLADAPGSYVHG